MDSEEFYAVFEPGLNYYLVEWSGSLDKIKVDHFRSFVGNRLYVASEDVIDEYGITPIEAPAVPEPAEPDDLFEEVAPEDQPDPKS